MKQKLALACTLVHEPALILLDEPTTGVDPVSRREFWKLLAEFLSRGVTIVMATPYLDEAERCSRVALLHEGRLLALDRPDTLRAQLPGSVAEMMTHDKRRTAELLERMPGVLGVQLFGERAHVRFDPALISGPAELSAKLGSQGVHVDDIRSVPPSLEDVFIARLGEATS
jgi:ABC-2 type transport system ATP-binding protein